MTPHSDRRYAARTFARQTGPELGTGKLAFTSDGSGVRCASASACDLLRFWRSSARAAAAIGIAAACSSSSIDRFADWGLGGAMGAAVRMLVVEVAVLLMRAGVQAAAVSLAAQAP